MATPGSFFDNTENYQPLRQGRSANVVCQGSLEPAKVRHESEEAKQRLKRGLETEDPLQAYVSYIRKLKDLYPSGSKLIIEALSEAADHFHDRPEYKNDPRLLNIFLQLADLQKDPRETFNFMQAHAVGNELPKFHMAMAAAFERAKDYKTAESCYSQAVSVAKCKPNAKEDFDLAMVHLTHFKRRMARLLQDSRALHGPGSPEASRATRAVAGTVRPGARPTLRPQTSAHPQQQQSVRPQSLGVASTAKRPQFAVFDERSAGGQQQPVSSKRPAEAQWPTLETDASARENNDLAQPWTEAAPITQRTGATQARPPTFLVYQEQAPSTIPLQSFQPKGIVPQHPAPHRAASAAKPPSFAIWTEGNDHQSQQQDPSSSSRPPAPSAVKLPSFQVWTEAEEKANEQEPPPASEAKQPSFTVWTESKPAKQQQPKHDFVEETAQQFSNMRVSKQVEEDLQASGGGAPNTVHSTPVSEERAGDHTINTRRALDDMFEMFASPSMSVARGQPSAVRPMFTPAIWPAQQIAGAAAGGIEEDDEEQNTSPNIVRMPNMTRPTTVRRPARSNRPALTTIEHHEERVSPSFRREIRNPPPKPIEKFSVARDTPGPAHGGRQQIPQIPAEDLTNDTFGISSVLAFGGNHQDGSTNSGRNDYYS